MKKLYVIPTTQVHKFWHKAIPHLNEAMKMGDGEYTIDQLKLLVTLGQQQLLLVLDEDKNCSVAFTVQWQNLGSDRLCYISYVGGKQTQDNWKEFVEWVKINGGTSIQGSTKSKAIVRLWRMAYKMQPKYTLMELKL